MKTRYADILKRISDDGGCTGWKKRDIVELKTTLLLEANVRSVRPSGVQKVTQYEITSRRSSLCWFTNPSKHGVHRRLHVRALQFAREEFVAFHIYENDNKNGLRSTRDGTIA